MPPYNEKNTSNFFGDTRTGRNQYVNGFLCVTGTATVHDDTYLGRNLNVSNAFTVDREYLYITTNVYDFQVLGKTLLNDLQVSATGVFQQLQVVGPTLLNVVEVQGPAVFDSSVLVNGLLTATGGLVVSEFFANSGTITSITSSSITSTTIVTDTLYAGTGFMGTLTVSSGAFIEGGINVNNNFTVDPNTGLVTVLGDFQVLGASLFNDIQVSGTGSFQNLETVGITSLLGPVNLYSGLSTTGSAYFHNDVWIEGTLHYSGPFDIKNLVVDSIIANSGTFQQASITTLISTGSATFQDVTILGTLSYTGALIPSDLVVDSITAKTGTFNYISVATGAFIQDLQVQTLEASGPSTFNGDVTINGLLFYSGPFAYTDITVDSITAKTGTFNYISVATGAFIQDLQVQTLTASGPAYLQSIVASGTAIFYDTIIATGGLITSSLTLDSITAQTGTIGTLISETGHFGWLTVSSGTILEGGLNVDNNFTVDPFTGLVTVLGDFQVLGTTLLNDLEVCSTGSFQQLIVYDKTTFVGPFLAYSGIVMTGTAIFNNDVYINGTLHYSGAFGYTDLVVDSITAKTGTFNYINVATGAFIQDLQVQTLEASGPSTFNGDVTINGLLFYSGPFAYTDITVDSITAKTGTFNYISVATGAFIQDLQVQTLEASGPAIFHDTVIVENFLIATGGIFTSSLTSESIYAQSGTINVFTSSTGIISYLTVSSGTILNGGLNVDNNFTVDPFTGLVTVLGDFQVLGTTLLNDLQVSSTGSFQQLIVYDKSTFVGPLLSYAGMSMTGTAIFNNDVYIYGTLHYSGAFGYTDLVVDSITAKTGTFNYISVATGAFIQDLQVQTLEASGPAIFHDTVIVENTLIATGGILTSSLTVDSINAQSGTINVFTSSTGVISYLTVSSGTILNGGLNVGNNFTVDPTTGLVTVLGDFQVLGNTVLNGLQVSSTGSFASLQVNGETLLSGGLVATGTSIFTNDVYIQGTLYYSGAASASGVYDSFYVKTLYANTIFATGAYLQTLEVTGSSIFHTDVIVDNFLTAKGVQASTGIFTSLQANILKVATGVVDGLNIGGNLTIGVTGPYGVTGGSVNIANIWTLNAMSGVMTQLGSMQVLGATLLNQLTTSSTGALSSLYVDKNITLNSSISLVVPVTTTPTFTVTGLRGQLAIMSGTQSVIVNNPIANESSHINCYLLNRTGFTGICPGVAYVDQSAGSFTVTLLGPTVGDMVLGWMIVN